MDDHDEDDQAPPRRDPEYAFRSSDAAAGIWVPHKYDPVMGKQEQRCGDDGSQGRGGLNDLCWEAIQISARFVNSATHLTRLARRGQ